MQVITPSEATVINQKVVRFEKEEVVSVAVFETIIASWISWEAGIKLSNTKNFLEMDAYASKV